LGFKVGHASRTVDECVKLSREDYVIRTSILEARRLIGDERLAEELQRRFRDEVMRGTGSDFVTAKLKERDERQARADTSRYLVEPNIKDGKGGLRDLNTLFWIAQYLHPVASPDHALSLEMFNRREVRAFLRAFNFLWSVRCHLHYATGRPEERLTFDLQPEIAARMGYFDRERKDGDNTPAVERFMRRYFLIAREVGVLTREFCAQLEADEAKKKPHGLSRFLPGRPKRGRRLLGAPGFLEEGGRLTIAGPQVFKDDPINLLRLFVIADRHDLDLHPDAFTAASRALPLITSKVRRDPEAAQAFLDVLARGRHTYATLTLMNEVGVLGRYVPEFGRIVAQMQFNMYHSYTVDEHTLRAVGVIADIARGEHDKDHPLATSVWPLIEDREVLFLAMLLHDTGKGGEGGQEKAGARAARSACERLGLERERIELVAWLVEHHLQMSDYAQKRDIGDPRTVAAFARIVENPERLRLLLVLTVADIRAVGPGVWNGWKGQLLRELFGATEAVFRGGRGANPAATFARHLHAEAQKAREALVAVDPGAAEWAASMEDAYFTNFTFEEHRAQSVVARRGQSTGGAAAQARILEDRNAAEITITAKDRQGLFADLAAALAGFGANVVGAKAYTSRTGQALDVFFLQDATGSAFACENPRTLARLVNALEAAARGERATYENHRALDLGRTAAFTIIPSVTIDNDASHDASVIEVSGLDRPGLLGALAQTLAEAGLSIQSAHIDGYGERAVDAFYVHGQKGEKLTGPRRIAKLKAALTAILDQDGGSESRGRLRLQRARASNAR
jgi:[protein-PII] uridylyltransferase